MVNPIAGQKAGQVSSADPSDKGVQPPQKDTETFTKEQHEAAQSKAVSDALSEAGRTATQLETQRKANIAETARHVQWQQERDAAEIAAVSDEPEKVTALKLKQGAQAERRELAKERHLLDAEKEASKQTNTEVTIWQVAHEAKVDPEKLKDELKDIGVTDPEQFKSVAKAVAKVMPKSTPDTPLADGGENTGGERSFSDLSPTEKISRSLKKIKQK